MSDRGPDQSNDVPWRLVNKDWGNFYFHYLRVRWTRDDDIRLEEGKCR